MKIHHFLNVTLIVCMIALTGCRGGKGAAAPNSEELSPDVVPSYHLPTYFSTTLGLTCNVDSHISFGTPVTLHVIVANTGNVNEYLSGFNNANTSLVKLYYSGHDVAKTPRGQAELCNEERYPWVPVELQGSCPEACIPPGKTYSYDIILTNYFVLDQCGTYFVTIRRRWDAFYENGLHRLTAGTNFSVVR